MTQDDDSDPLTPWWWRGITQDDDSVPLAQIMMMGNNTRWRRTPLLMKYSNKNLKCHKLASQDPVKLVCAPPKALAKLWFTTFVKTAPCQTWKSLTKLRSQYCLDIASKHWKDLLQTQLQCNIFSSCNPLPFNNCELSLPLRLPDYVSHSLVKMLSQTKLFVLPLQTKTNRHPNKNQCKIIWLSLFAKQKPFRDHFLWLVSVIIFRDYFFLPLQQQTMQRNAKSNVVSLWE